MTVFPPLCICREAIATVELRRDGRTRRMCKRCAGIVEMLLELMGAEAKRGPILELIRGSVE